MRRISAALTTAALLAAILPLQTMAAGSTPQTITFGALPDATYGAVPFGISASTDSALEITFTSLTTGVCTVAPDAFTADPTTAMVTIVHRGTCTIEATQDGDATYEAATPVDQGFTVSPAAQTVTALSHEITYGDADPTFSFNYGPWQGSDTAAVVTAAPTCGVTGAHDQVAGSPYAIHCSGAAADDYTFGYVDGSLTIDQAAPLFSITAPSTAYDGTPHAASGFAHGVTGTGEVLSPAVTFSYLGTGGTTYGPTATAPTDVGSYSATASYAGSSNYAPGTSEAIPFTIGQATQTISFDLSGVTGKTFGDAPFSVAGDATASSGLAVSFASQTPGVCTTGGANGATVTIVGAGACTIRASQDGNPDYSAAPAVDQGVSIAKADQTVAFTSADPSPVVLNDTFTPAASATSGLPVAITVDPASSATCSIDVSGLVTITAAAGSCVLDADQPGDADYNAAPRVQQLVSINNRKPVCAPTATLDVVMNVAASGPANCSDPDGNPIATYAIGTDGTLGHATIDPVSGAWTYTPGPNATGSDSFTVLASDGLADSDPASIAVTITNSPVSGSLQIQHVGVISPTVIDVLADPAISAGAGDAGQPLTVAALSTTGTVGRVTTDGRTVTYYPNSCSTATDVFSFTLSDGLTTASIPVAVIVDRPGVNGRSAKPVTRAPSVSLVSGSTIGSTTPVRLGWCAVTASNTSVSSYRIAQSTNGGARWTSTLVSSTTTASRTFSVSSSYHFVWGVRTTDRKGATSAYASSLVTRVARTESASSAIVYHGSWRTAKSSSYSGSSDRYATSTSATATFKTVTTARQFAIVASRAKTRGYLRVYVDGVYVGAVSERSSSAQYRRVLYVRSLTPGVSHTIVLKPYGNGRVDLDAILTLQ